MKVAFVIERNLYYKFYGPVIERMLSEGFEIHLFHRRSEFLNLKNSKLFYYPFLNQIPQFDKKIQNIQSFTTNEDLNQRLTKSGINVVLSIHSRSYYQFQKSSIEWVVLQHGVDTFKETAFDADALIVYSKEWLNQMPMKMNKDVSIVESGMYFCDVKSYDRKTICNKYGLNPLKKYVLLSPVPDNSYKSYPFIKGTLRRYFSIKDAIKDELKLIEWLKSELNFEVIIKSRFKRFLSPDYSEVGHVFYDETFYPSSVNELLYISEALVVNFMPGGIMLEAAMLNKDYIVIKDHKTWPEMLDHCKSFLNMYLPRGSEKDVFEYGAKSEIAERLKNIKELDLDSYRAKFIQPDSNENSLDIILRVVRSL